jgi:hypothetical protein
MENKEIIEMLIANQEQIIQEARQAISDLEKIPTDSPEFNRKLKKRLQMIANDLKTFVKATESDASLYGERTTFTISAE